MNHSIEVALDGYVETLERLQNLGAYPMPDDVWDMFIALLKRGLIFAEKGPYSALEYFATEATIVRREDFEKKYPLYAKTFTWEEFIENECQIGNEKVAVVSID